MLLRPSITFTATLTVLLLQCCTESWQREVAQKRDVSGAHAIAVEHVPEQGVSCQNNVMNQLDQYLKEMEILNGKRKFPDTIAKLKEACK